MTRKPIKIRMVAPPPQHLGERCYCRHEWVATKDPTCCRFMEPTPPVTVPNRLYGVKINHEGDAI